MVEVAQRECQTKVPNPTKVVVETHRPKSVAKRLDSFQANGEGKDKSKIRFLAQGGTLGSWFYSSKLGGLNSPSSFVEKYRS